MGLSSTLSATEGREWPEGSAMHTGGLLVAEMEAYQQKSDSILNRIYQKIDDEYHNQTIQKQVAAFREYAASACHIVGVSSGAGGSWPSTYSVRCQQGIAYDHYRSLKRSLACIERLEQAAYVFPGERMNCVIQTLNMKFF